MAKVLRKIIEIDEELCNGCGQCVLACQEGALAIVNGKAKLIGEFLCDGLGACIGECPTGALKIVEREAEEFDEEAVAEHLKKFKDSMKVEKEAEPFHGGCPSMELGEFLKKDMSNAQSMELSSALSHWPVKIRLVPASAPFLKGAKLLVCADCVPVAYPNLHTKLLPGHKILIGCPKLDPVELYIEKFREILEKVPLEGLEVAIMEVPCCRGLIYILKEAMKLAQREIPLKTYTISVRGKLLHMEVI